MKKYNLQLRLFPNVITMIHEIGITIGTINKANVIIYALHRMHTIMKMQSEGKKIILVNEKEKKETIFVTL